MNATAPSRAELSVPGLCARSSCSTNCNPAQRAASRDRPGGRASKGCFCCLQAKDPTIAQLLKPHGYATGQIGKNHPGDRNELLPTVHGFGEFYGILYHLNAMQEPYEDSYPKKPEFRARFGPRNIIDSGDLFAMRYDHWKISFKSIAGNLFTGRPATLLDAVHPHDLGAISISSGRRHDAFSPRFRVGREARGARDRHSGSTPRQQLALGV